MARKHLMSRILRRLPGPAAPLRRDRTVVGARGVHVLRVPPVEFVRLFELAVERRDDVLCRTLVPGVPILSHGLLTTLFRTLAGLRVVLRYGQEQIARQSNPKLLTL
jgi:hypothetical protein